MAGILAVNLVYVTIWRAKNGLARALCHTVFVWNYSAWCRNVTLDVKKL